MSSEIRIKFNLWQIVGCKKLILAKTEQEFFCLKKSLHNFHLCQNCWKFSIFFFKAKNRRKKSASVRTLKL